MSDETSPLSEFETSARRFEDAAAALGELRDKLGTLSNLKAQQDEAAQALEESNATLHAVIEALSPVGEVGADLLASLKSAVAAAETVFDQHAVEAVRDDITTLNEEVSLLRKELREDQDLLAERDQARSELESLQAKLRALPERLRNKHGLT